MGQQIAGYKVEMCKSEIKVKLMPFPSFRKGLYGLVISYGQ